MALTLTFDLGTTYFKGAVFDEQGTLRALARRPLVIVHPQPERWEMSVDAFRRTLQQLAGELSESLGGLDEVRALSFATQANSFALLDRQDRAITPMILWPDNRARNQEPSIGTLLAGAVTPADTGVPCMNHQFSLAKLAWLRDHQPDVWRQARRVVYLSDYLVLWLSGEHVTEAGAAGLTGILDVQRLSWSLKALERLQIPAPWLPTVTRAGTHLGTIRARAADALGLPASCRLVLGCLDQYAGAIGAGNVTPGRLSETTGTVLATVQCADHLELQPAPEVFQGPAFRPGLFFRMVFGDISGSLLERYRNSLPDRPSFDELTQAASEVPAGADGLSLCERPHLAPPAEMFVGRSACHGRGHEVRAILEAVAGALAHQVHQLATHAPPEGVRSVGGAARSELWRQIKADRLGCPIVGTACPEPTSLGAAILAAASLGGQPVAAIAQHWVKTLPPNLPITESEPCP